MSENPEIDDFDDLSDDDRRYVETIAPLAALWGLNPRHAALIPEVLDVRAHVQGVAAARELRFGQVFPVEGQPGNLETWRLVQLGDLEPDRPPLRCPVCHHGIEQGPVGGLRPYVRRRQILPWGYAAWHGSHRWTVEEAIAEIMINPGDNPLHRRLSGVDDRRLAETIARNQREREAREADAVALARSLRAPRRPIGGA